MPYIPSEEYKVQQKQLELTESVLKDVETRLQNADMRADYLNESYVDAVRSMLQLEDAGWNLLGTRPKEGFSLEQLRQISYQLREWSDTNPLLVHGHEVRSSYLFATGYDITREDGSPTQSRYQKIIDDPLNQRAVFSLQALSSNERSRYTDGNLFILWDKITSRFSRLQFGEVYDAVYNPDDVEDLWFIMRSYTRREVNIASIYLTPEAELVRIWYATDTYRGTVPDQINGFPVSKSVIIIDDRVNRHAGATWGVPDSFAAAPWALAYSAYLRDGTKLLASLAEYAWKITPKTASGALNAGAALASNRGAGKNIVSNDNIQSLPRNNAVDLHTGRPIAAQAAAALGISVSLLLADPGESGSFGAAQTLTDPTVKTMQFRQNENEQFLRRCLAVMGMTDADIIWGDMATDSKFREQQTLILALDTGLFWADEIREDMAELIGIELKHPAEPEGFMLSNNSLSAEVLSNQQIAVAAGTAQAVAAANPANGTAKPGAAGSGKSNPAGPISAGNNDMKAADKKTSQKN
jgi:hypothetical protein